MDVRSYLELKPAPRAVFDHLEQRRDLPRFMLPESDGWRPITNGQFAEEIRDIALFLNSGDLRPGERAAIYAPNRVEWLSAAMAIQAAHGVMVPIYPTLTAAQAAYIATHSDAAVLFVDTQALVDRLASVADELGDVRRIVLLDAALVAPEALEDRCVHWARARSFGAARHRESPTDLDTLLSSLDLDQPGVMLYTSGTSGDPKGVPLTHRNVGTNGRDWLEVNGPVVEERDVDLLWLPFSHIFGFGEACLGNTLNWVSYLVTPAEVFERLPEVRPHVFMSVPVVWETLAIQAAAAEEPPARLRELTGGRLRFGLSGGAGLKVTVKEAFEAAGMLILEGYGLTEASPTLTLNRPDDYRFDSVGKPIPSVELRLAEDGEILARGPNVFAGYHKDPAASALAFTDDGWLKTGDVGRFTDDGFLQIIDRKKDILVTAGGKNVAPANIERRFADDPNVAHCVVYGDARKYLVAGLWPTRPDADAAVLETSVQRANEGLARFETIKRFVVIDTPLTAENGFLTPTLKVRRKRVVEAFADRFEALYEA